MQSVNVSKEHSRLILMRLLKPRLKVELGAFIDASVPPRQIHSPNSSYSVSHCQILLLVLLSSFHTKVVSYFFI